MLIEVRILRSAHRLYGENDIEFRQLSLYVRYNRAVRGHFCNATNQVKYQSVLFFKQRSFYTQPKKRRQSTQEGE